MLRVVAFGPRKTSFITCSQIPTLCTWASASALFLMKVVEFPRFKATKNKPANAFSKYVTFPLAGHKNL